MSADVTAQARPRNLPSLTSLRAFAAFAVFGFHAAGLLALFGTGKLGRFAKDVFAAGPTGVSFFFVLSGFVLTWAHRSDGTSKGPRQAASFWRQRAARILPAYFLAWALGYAVLSFLGHAPPFAGVAASLFLVQVWSSNPDVIFAVNIVAWSLAVEAIFYLLFPVMLPLLKRLNARRRPLAMAVLAFIPLLIAVIEQAVHGSNGYLWLVSYFPLARLPEFLLGALLALEIREGRWRRIPLLPAAGLALGAYLLAGQAPQAFMWVSITLVPYVVLIAAAAQSDLVGARSCLRVKGAERLGAWSYAFYLVQVPIGLVLAHYWHPLYRSTGMQLAVFVAYLAFTWAVSAAIYRFVERPMHARLAYRPRTAVAAPTELNLAMSTPPLERVV